MKKCIFFWGSVILVTAWGCGGMVKNTKPMLVKRYDRMKMENTTMFAIVQGGYLQAKAHADRVLTEHGYGNILYDLSEHRMFVYGKESDFIDPQYKAAQNSFRVVLRFFELLNGTTRVEVMNSCRIRGIQQMVDQDMAGLVKAFSE